MQVRPMRTGEVDAAIAVWQAANAARDKHADPERVSRVRAKLAAADASVYVATDEEDAIVGMALLEPGHADDGAGPVVPSLVHVSMVFVHPAAQRRGVGGALMSGALEDARARGVTGASLWTATDNDPARRLYAHVGMRPAETRQVTQATTWVRYIREL